MVVVVGSSPNLIKDVDCGVGKVFGLLLDHHHSSHTNLPVSRNCFTSKLFRSDHLLLFLIYDNE